MIILQNSIKNSKSTNPSIAIYGIYKDEEKFIERYLNSIKEADEIVLCDTGSIDETNNIIEKFKRDNCDVNLKTYKIFVSPWRFDDARNAALSLISPKTELCISLDIDEYLLPGWKEQLSASYDQNITRYHHMFKTIWSKGNETQHRHERIHSRIGYTWHLPVHEILEYKGEERAIYLPDFWIIQEPQQKNSRTSYLSLLEKSVSQRKEIWKSYSFLASEYLNASRHNDALSTIDKALQIENSDKAYLYKMKFWVYKSQNNYNLALQSINEAINYIPNRREPYYDKASYLHELGRNCEAYFCILQGEKCTNEIIDYHHNSIAWNNSFSDLKERLRKKAEEEWKSL